MQPRSLWGSHLIRPPPIPREVHFWCVFPDQLHDANLLKAYEGFLSPQEQEQLAAAASAKSRKEHLLARMLVRTTIARYTGGNVDPSSLKFVKNKYGKPEVVWPVGSATADWAGRSASQLRFNLSHTRSLVACGVTVDSAIGVDVEHKGRALSSDLMTFARRKLSRVEAGWLEKICDSEKRRLSFLQLWTLKEAYVKAVGKGISGTSLQGFSVWLKSSHLACEQLERATGICVDAEAREIVLDVHDAAALKSPSSALQLPSPWQFVLFEPSVDVYASICVERGGKDGDDALAEEPQSRFKFWRTVPLCEDTPLGEGAIALALGPVC